MVLISKIFCERMGFQNDFIVHKDKYSKFLMVVYANLRSWHTIRFRMAKTVEKNKIRR